MIIIKVCKWQLIYHNIYRLAIGSPFVEVDDGISNTLKSFYSIIIHYLMSELLVIVKGSPIFGNIASNCSIISYLNRYISVDLNRKLSDFRLFMQVFQHHWTTAPTCINTLAGHPMQDKWETLKSTTHLAYLIVGMNKLYIFSPRPTSYIPHPMDPCHVPRLDLS